MKLSCRMHQDPKAIFDAYCLGKDCDILEVLGERLSLTNRIKLPQSALPIQALRKFLTCREKGCAECGYCSALAKSLLEKEGRAFDAAFLFADPVSVST